MWHYTISTGLLQVRINWIFSPQPVTHGIQNPHSQVAEKCSLFYSPGYYSCDCNIIIDQLQSDYLWSLIPSLHNGPSALHCYWWANSILVSALLHCCWGHLSARNYHTLMHHPHGRTQKARQDKVTVDLFSCYWVTKLLLLLTNEQINSTIARPWRKPTKYHVLCEIIQ